MKEGTLVCVRERERLFVLKYREATQTGKGHTPNTQGRARRKHGGDQGHPGEAV